MYFKAYINNPAQRPDRIRPVDHITTHCRRVFHNTARDHDNILSRLRELLDDKVDHLSERSIFVLEQLADAEEEGGGFVGWELLASKEEERDLGEENSAFPRRYGGCVEDAGCITCCEQMC